MSENVRRGGHGAKPITPDMVRRWRRWEADGIPRREMSRRDAVSLRRIMLVLGKKPPREIGNPRPVWNVYTHRKPWQEAAKIAKALGYRIAAGENTGHGSVGSLVEAIGSGEVVVVPAAEYQRLRGLDH